MPSIRRQHQTKRRINAKTKAVVRRLQFSPMAAKAAKQPKTQKIQYAIAKSVAIDRSGVKTTTCRKLFYRRVTLTHGPWKKVIQY